MLDRSYELNYEILSVRDRALAYAVRNARCAEDKKQPRTQERSFSPNCTLHVSQAIIARQLCN